MREYPLISEDTGRDLTFDDPVEIDIRVLETIENICEAAVLAWVSNPNSRRVVISHLIQDHGLHGDDLERFLYDCDYSHLWNQLGPHETKVGLLYKRDA